MKSFKVILPLLFLMSLSPILTAQIPDSLSDIPFLGDSTIADTITNLSNPTPPQKTRWVRGVFNAVGAAPKAVGHFFTAKYPHPGKAALFSFVVPGLGQAYNKKFWKLPIVYTAVGSMVYMINSNSRNYKIWKTAYRQRVDGDPTTIDQFVGDYPQASHLKTIRDGYQKRREQAYIGLVVALALGAADAFVDAHLLKFNVNDDLSVRLKPGAFPVSGTGMGFGLGVGVRLVN